MKNEKIVYPEMLKCPTCEKSSYIKNKGCADTICTEFEILITDNKE